MSLKDCFQVRGLSDKQHQEFLELYNEILEREQANLGVGTKAAETSAENIVLDLVQRRAREHRYQGLMQIEKTRQLLSSAEVHTEGKGAGILARLGYDIHSSMKHFSNAESLTEAVKGETWEILADAINKFRPRKAGFQRQRAGEEELVDAIYGDINVSEEAKYYADAIDKADKYQLARKRLAGAIIPDIADRFPGKKYLPNPSHDMRRVRHAASIDDKNRLGFFKGRKDPTDADRNAYITDLLKGSPETGGRPWLDLDLMIDWETGQKFKPDELIELLGNVWETISYDGMNKIRPGQRVGKRMLGNIHTFPRVIHLTKEGWKAYNRKYGNDDIFATIIHHFERGAREIATMEVLGPNPDHTLKVAEDWLRLNGEKERVIRRAKEVYNRVSGNEPIEGEMLAGFGSNLRSFVSAQVLGSALTSAVSDPGLSMHAAQMIGLDPMKALSAWSKGVKSELTRDEFSEQLTRMGVIIDDMIGSAIAGNRYVDAMETGRLMGRYADIIMRIQGLTPFTNGGRRGNYQFYLSEIQAHLKYSFAELKQKNKLFSEFFERYGISEKDWSLMQKTIPFEWRDVQFFNASSLLDIEGVNPVQAMELGSRIRAALMEQVENAVPVGTARAKTLLSFGTVKGTAPGEIMRGFGMLKTFPANMIMVHLMRIFTQPGMTKTQRGLAFSRLLLYTTTFGTLGYQLQQMSFGRDPATLDITSKEGWETIFRGMLKGGALGIYGDILFKDISGYGRGILTVLAGPGFEFINDSASISLGSLQKRVSSQFSDKDTHIKAQFVDYFDKWMMPGTSLWYSRLAKDRILTDNLRRFADPEHAYRREQRLKSLAKERQQYYYAPPGEGIKRPPHLGAIFGGGTP